MISTPEPRSYQSRTGGVSSALASLLVHAVVVALVWLAAAQRPVVPDFVSYQIDLVSLPEVVADPGSPLVEALPTAPPPATEGVPPPAPTPEEVAEPPEPEPETENPAPEIPPDDPVPQRPTATRPPDAETGAATSDAINVRMEGLRRDYPAYYNNIILQIRRCFRWAGQGTPETEVYFVIIEDGSVSDVRFVRQSGNPSFDYEALGAVECAGQPGHFGPLPDDLPFDRLPIRFNFRPGNDGIFR